MKDQEIEALASIDKEALEKRKKALMRYLIPEQRSLLNSLMLLTKTELDDIRYNLCVQGISSLKKQELAEALVPEILAFSHKWFITIGMEQYNILQDISQNNGITLAIDSNDLRLDYMRCLGLVFSGEQNGKLAWYLPKELLDLYSKMDQLKFKNLVALNDQVVRLTSGLLFYYGFLTYEQIYAKVIEFIKPELSFIDFMGILINAGCWLDNIINVDTGMHYYTVMDYEALTNRQLDCKDLDFYPFTLAEINQAGEPNYIAATDNYKALVGFFMQSFSLPVMTATDIVGELQIILLNDESFSEMLDYIGSILTMPNQETAETMVQLLTKFNNTTRLWSLKGYCPNELAPERKQIIAPYAVKQTANNVVQFVPLSSSVGRNDLCPCGSGKKYKKCCLNKEI